MEVYGDLKNGYVEFTLWHERLTDLIWDITLAKVPYKVYLDAITPQNEIKRNWFYLQDINPHTLIFVPQTQQDVSSWAVAHPLNTDVFKRDCDGDALDDDLEIFYRTYPYNPDCDNDGLLDGFEINSFYYRDKD
ncbi:MAG: hypothetical protein QW115_03700, partial [Thermoplasmata archaeon]